MDLVQEIAGDWRVIAAVAALVVVGLAVSFLRPSRPKAPNMVASTGGGGVANQRAIRIFYGSQTGRSESFAQRLAEEAESHNLSAEAVNLEAWAADGAELLNLEGEEADEPMVCIFCVATYGEGDPTDNAVEFDTWLAEAAEERGAAAAAHVHFAVFGLGNSSYEHFNAMGKRTRAGLEALGASEFYAYGEGDEIGELEDDFEVWVEGIWPALKQAVASVAGASGQEAAAAAAAAAAGAEASAEAGQPRPHRCKLSLDLVAPPAAAPQCARDPRAAMPREVVVDMAQSAAIVSKPYFQCEPVRVAVCREVRQAPARGASTVHVELDLKGSALTYESADNLVMLPENQPEEVEAVAARLGYDLEQWFTLTPTEPPASAEAAAGAGGRRRRSSSLSDAALPFPVPCSVRTALTRYCDLLTTPTKTLLGQLALHAGSPEERERLLHLCSSAGRQQWAQQYRDTHTSLLELLEAFPSVQLPLGLFVELCPRLKAREYTIASSSVVHPQRIHLAVSVIEEDKPGDKPGRSYLGVCSSYLADRAVPAGQQGSGRPVRSQPPADRRGDKAPTVLVTVRPSTFHLPKDPSCPVIMVGPGTGLAPMRAFCQELRQRRAELGPDAVGDAWLFFGCQHPERDFIYQEELEGYAEDGTLAQFVVAFSRLQERKVYVQDRLRQRAATLWGLLERGAHVYVCGATRMGQGVREAFEEVARKEGGLTDKQAHAWLQRLEHQHRYTQELWA